MTTKVIAGDATETTTGVERGLDVPVTVTLPDGREVEGEVTLLPAEDGRPTYESWGEPDHWVDGRLLRELRKAFPDYSDLRKILARLAAIAGEACPR